MADPFSVLFVSAHPDDESLLAGGTLGLLAQRGHAVHIVCATRGEGGELGEPPVTEDRSQLGSIREDELRCAAAALGAKEVTMLDYIDPLIGPGDELYAFTADFGVLVAQLAGIMDRQAVDLILTHGTDGEYGHPAHRLIHNAVLEAVRTLDAPSVLYSAAAIVPGIEDHIWNKSDPSHLALNIEPWLEIKHAAVLCHVSQHALFKRRRKLTNVRDSLRRVESFHRRWPGVPPGEAPHDFFAEFLLGIGAWRPRHGEREQAGQA
jgi:LmbE family N-acetylglucosaminyl deacetylase